MSVHVVHPDSGGDLTVDDDALVHMRASGWMTAAEWEANEIAAAERRAAAEKASSKTATKDAAKSG